MTPTARHQADGFSLVELCVVLAIAGVLATVAWPAFESQLQRGRRADAVAALLRLQLAQEHYRSRHGLYASQLGVLVGAAGSRSSQGWYDIALLGAGGDGYEARASARADSPAARDSGCAVLSLQVRDGIAELAPSPRCWNR
jgi:type IV pilus assembly protein PilE